MLFVQGGHDGVPPGGLCSSSWRPALVLPDEKRFPAKCPGNLRRPGQRGEGKQDRLLFSPSAAAAAANFIYDYYFISFRTAGLAILQVDNII